MAPRRQRIVTMQRLMAVADDPSMEAARAALVNG
jgi:hypothetical protein